jgi:formimidoylglutamate deiminase
MNDAAPQRLYAAHALLPDGWARDVLLAWDGTGTLTAVQVAAAPPAGVPHAAGVLIPGLPNLHSHAFQRAFAGLTEYRRAATGRDDRADNFWAWRELMYRVALGVAPDQLEAIATQVYIEMLHAGYTAVCEFHYLHHDPRGRPYADPAEMSLRLLAAAQRAGIGLTLLPVLYQQAGFGAQPARTEQRRFIKGTDALLALFERLRRHVAEANADAGASASSSANARGAARVGIAPHSLRAVGPGALRDVVAGVQALDASAPIHLHIAEQPQEVRDCVAWSGQRPVAWLLANAPVDARWCLVHATHMNPVELQGVAASGAVAGLCPTTEANLGDGVLDAAAYAAANGAWGIGSDSHASISGAEELRLLEYTQRLAQNRRNVLASAAQPQAAEHLWLGAVRGGARASGRAIGGLRVGQQADFVVLDTAGTLAGLAPSQVLASHVFAHHGRSALREVGVAGRQRVHAGAHALDRVACEHFVAARGALLSEV